MAAYSDIIAEIEYIVKANDNQEITGTNMQQVLLNMVDDVGGKQLKGYAVPSTIPAVPIAYSTYLATEAGFYSGFNVTVPEEGLYLIDWSPVDEVWILVNIPIPVPEPVPPVVDPTKPVYALGGNSFEWNAAWTLSHHPASIGAEPNGLWRDGQAFNLALATEDTAGAMPPSAFASIDYKQEHFPGWDRLSVPIATDIVIDNIANTVTLATINGAPISPENPVIYWVSSITPSPMRKYVIEAPVVFNYNDTANAWWYFYFNEDGLAVVSTAIPPANSVTLLQAYNSGGTFTSRSLRTYPATLPTVALERFKLDGAKVYTGLQIIGNPIDSPTAPTVNGGNTCVSATPGTILEGNFYYSVTSTPTPTLAWQQDLGATSGITSANSGLFRVFFSDTTGMLSSQAATNYPFPFVGDVIAYYNNNGNLIPLANNEWGVYFVYVVQDWEPGYPVRIMTAPRVFANKTLADAYTWENVANELNFKPGPNVRQLAKLTYEHRTSYNVATKQAALRSLTDLRTQPYTLISVSSASTADVNVVITLPPTGLVSTNQRDMNSEIVGLIDGYLKLTGGTLTGQLNTQNLVPTTDNSYDIGTAALAYKNAFLNYIVANTIEASGLISASGGTSAQWTLAYSWGNHATEGYIKTETDPIFTASPAYGITDLDILRWDTAYGWGNPSGLYLPLAGGTMTGSILGVVMQEVGGALVPKTSTFTLGSSTDPWRNIFASNLVYDGTGSSDLWNTAYSWGNHAGLYEPKLGNPVGDGYVLSSTSAGIRSWIPMTGGMVYPASGLALSSGAAWGTSVVNNSANWNTAFNWGNHAAAGYLKTETDPVFLASPAGGITNGDITNWNTAYSWGNPANTYEPKLGNPVGDGYVLSSTSAGVRSWIPMTGGMVYPASGLALSSGAAWGTSVVNNSANWNTAFSWGNHAGLYLLLTGGTLTGTVNSRVIMPVTTATYDLGASTKAWRNIFASSLIYDGTGSSDQWNLAYSWGNHANLYEPKLGNPTGDGYVLSSTSTGVRSWIPMTGGMVYPGSGLALSSGSAWGTSVTNNSVNWNTAYSWGNHASAGYLKTETDPVFVASPAYGITSQQIVNWNTAYGWGNHASAGYLKTETDPIFVASPAYGITSTQIAHWELAYGWGDHSTAGYLKTETDPIFVASPAYGITSQNIANWNTAYGWGNHANLYEPKLGNPVGDGYVLSSTSAGVRSWIPMSSGMVYPSSGLALSSGSAWGTSVVNNSANWNTAYSWGNHASAGYLKTETDPVFVASPAYGITSQQIINWNTAYGWGNHATEGYLKTETDPVFVASPAYGITSTQIVHWDLAYGWGNHASAGYLKTETDPIFTASPAYGITSQNITNWNTAYSWGNHAGIYLPLTGGTLSGILTTTQVVPTATGTWDLGTAAKMYGSIYVNEVQTDTVYATGSVVALGGNSNNWNTAYGWGNHASAGYLKTETDPIFAASPAYGITSQNISDWNSAVAVKGYANIQGIPGEALINTSTTVYLTVWTSMPLAANAVYEIEVNLMCNPFSTTPRVRFLAGGSPSSWEVQIKWTGPDTSATTQKVLFEEPTVGNSYQSIFTSGAAAGKPAVTTALIQIRTKADINKYFTIGYNCASAGEVYVLPTSSMKTIKILQN